MRRTCLNLSALVFSTAAVDRRADGRQHRKKQARRFALPSAGRAYAYHRLEKGHG